MELEKLTIKQAYIAAYLFLLKYFVIDKEPEYLKGMLSEMSLVKGENPADPAIWPIWLEAVKEALEDESAADFKGKVFY